MSTRTQSTLFAFSLAASASAFALLYVEPSLAQQAAQPAAQPEAAGGGLEEIVVTARRKEEKAQTVPIFVSTQNQTALEEMHFANIRDIISHTPGMSQANAGDVSNYLFIRGVQNAIIYMDDAPLISPPYPGNAIGFDLGGVQVLKGPQGTLFGVAADPGAVLYTTNPTTSDFGGRIEAEAGDYGHKHLEGVLNVPVIDDKLAVRAGGLYQHLDGFLPDVTTGVKTGSQDFDIYRATITARPTDNIQNDFMIDYFWTDGVPAYVKAWYINPAPKLTALGVTTTAAVGSYGPGILVANKTELSMGRYAFFAGTFRPGGEYSSNHDYFMNDTARWDINDNMTLKNILAYEQVQPGTVNSGTSPYPATWYPLGATAQAQLNAHPLVAGAMTVQYTDDLQLLGKVLDDKLGYTAGFFDLRGGTRQPKQGPVYNASASLSGGAVSGSETWGIHAAQGVYAQGTYDLGAILEGLSFTLGARYSWDQEYLDTSAFNGLGVRSAQASLTESSREPSYLLSLDYQVDSSTLIYVSDAKGNDRGGVVGGSVPFTYPSIGHYSPETLVNYEVGVKADWEAFGVKARTNFAAFYGDYTNVQTIVNLSAPSPIPGVPPAQVDSTANAASAFIEGIDGDFTVVPTDDLTLNLGFNYTYLKANKFVNAGQDWSDATFFYNPRLTYTGTVTYQLPFLEWAVPGQDLGRMAFAATYYWEAHEYGGTYYPQPALHVVPSWGTWEMNVSWKSIMGSDGLDGRVYVENLLENYALTYTGSAYNTTGTVGVNSAPPRTWGFSVSKTF